MGIVFACIENDPNPWLYMTLAVQIIYWIVDTNVLLASNVRIECLLTANSIKVVITDINYPGSCMSNLGN